MQSLPLRLDEMKSGKSTVTERVLKHKEGTPVDVEISSKMLPNGYLLGMVRDIGERKRAEEALRAREERFRLAMENIPDVVVIYDPDLRIQFINNATTILTGRPVSDYIGYRDDEIWSPEVYETYLPALEEAIEFKRMTSVEIDITVPGGSPLAVVVTCVPILDRDNNVREILGITHNLTERKHAEQALQRYNQRLTALRQIDKDIIGAQSTRNIVNTVLESVSELIPCQRASVTLIDKERSEVVVYAIVADDDTRIIDGIRNPLPDSSSQQLLERGDSLILSDLQHLPEPTSDLVKQLIKEGQRSLIAIPMFVQSEFIGSLNLSTNTTGYFTAEHEEILREIANQLSIAIYQSRLNEQIKNMNQVLEQRVAERTAQFEVKNQELETFTYTVSHDLKAPLRGIDGYSRLLLEDYMNVLDEQGQTFLHNVRSATEQMNQLIDDLLAFSRLERRSLKAMELNLRHVAESIVAERQRDIDEISANVSISVPDMVASVDSDGFNMALRNLLDNALKFSKVEQSPIIEIGGYEDKDSYVIWIKDKGIGFDMKYHDRILQIFHRLHRSEDYAGTGIGLAIVQKAMERMGGRVRAESEPEIGSTFYLEIPK